jgi:hypothetical protein
VVAASLISAGLAASLDAAMLTPLVLFPRRDEVWMPTVIAAAQTATAVLSAVPQERRLGMRWAIAGALVGLLLLGLNGLAAFALDWGPQRNPQVGRLLLWLTLQMVTLVSAVVCVRREPSAA